MATIFISSNDDVIDSRDVIEHIEELEREAIAAYEEEHGEIEGDLPDDFTAVDWLGDGDAQDLIALRELAEQGSSLPDWPYGVVLVRDSYFEDFAREEAEQLGLVSESDRWPATCIDWAMAAAQLQVDYTSVEFDRVTYWARA